MRICMASDFFYPNMGGVEEHIFNLSQCLLAKGHDIIVITHSYQDRKGVRYLTKGLKVYYLPIRTFYNQCILPTMMCNIPLLRYILLRERIQIVHGHSAFSALAHETMFVGKLLGLRVVFTDHSLFGFADLSAVVTNKLLEITLSTCNHCICVSHTGKENTVLRAKVSKENVSVIPNAVDTAYFTPNPIDRRCIDGHSQQVTVVIVSRLVYRKGVDLMAGVISKLVHMKNVNFIIGGDGPKRSLLEEIREKNNMQDRVTLLGPLEHSKVREVLRSGHIFLNTSLTEAYCMAIVEAASCGLQVVSTRVGGIPEVLPSNLITLTDASIDALYDGLMTAIETILHQRQAANVSSSNGRCSDKQTLPIHRKYIPKKQYVSNTIQSEETTTTTETEEEEVLCPYKRNEIVRKLYNWNNITVRTEKVYRRVMNEADPVFGDKLNFYRNACAPFILVVSFSYLLLRFLDWFEPRRFIDVAVPVSSKYKSSFRKKSK